MGFFKAFHGQTEFFFLLVEVSQAHPGRDIARFFGGFFLQVFPGQLLHYVGKDKSLARSGLGVTKVLQTGGFGGKMVIKHGRKYNKKTRARPRVWIYS